jgi:DnaK suppressor protein
MRLGARQYQVARALILLHAFGAARGLRFSFADIPFDGSKIALQSGISLSNARKSEMDRRNLDRYKRVLLEKRGEMSVTSTEASSPIPAAGGHRGDPVDQANANTEAELQIHLHETDLRLLRAIEEALARIRQGTFGTCETCRNPISRARLEAVPWTRHCRDCKEREHSL